MLRGEFRPGGHEREWCDAEVLRQLRRRSLAVLRKEVEPVEPAALRPLPARLARRRLGPAAASTRWSRRSACLQGAAIPASSLDADVLRVARGRATGPPTSTRLPARASWSGWAPAPSGPSDGRVRLYFRDQLAAAARRGRAPPTARRRPAHVALREHLERRGACFFGDLRAAAPGATDPELLGRAVGPGVGGRGHQRLAGAAAVAGRRGGRPQAQRRAEPAPLGRPGACPQPPSARPAHPARPAGRRRALEPGGPAARARAAAHRGRPRPGPAARSSATACSPARRCWPRASTGGFAGVYGVLKVLEERGQVRRGYFVAGQGAAQFALPGAVDRLRALPRRAPMPTTAAGAGRHRPRPALRRRPGRGPTRPAVRRRAAGALVVLAGDGDACALARPAGPPPGDLPRRPPRGRRGSTPSSPW